MKWSAEDAERLKQMWAAGKSPKEIAFALKTSRCAVLGKVHRLRLEKRAPWKSYRVARKRKNADIDERRIASREADYSLPGFLLGYLD
jgi:hypothetical protein